MVKKNPHKFTHFSEKWPLKAKCKSLFSNPDDEKLHLSIYISKDEALYQEHPAKQNTNICCKHSNNAHKAAAGPCKHSRNSQQGNKPATPPKPLYSPRLAFLFAVIVTA